METALAPSLTNFSVQDVCFVASCRPSTLHPHPIFLGCLASFAFWLVLSYKSPRLSGAFGRTSSCCFAVRMESHGGPDESIRYMGTEISSCSCKSSLHISRKTSWGTPIPAPSTINPSDATMHNIDLFDEVDLDVDCGVSVATDGGAAWNTVENIAALGLSFNSDTSPPKRPLALTRFSLDDCKQANINTSGPPLHHRFEKWMKTLQKKAVQRRKTVSGNLNGVAHELHWHDAEEKEHWMSRHKKSSSGSSLGFVTVMKSASISLASFSMAPRSRKTGVSSRHQRTNHSSRGFNAGLRFSEESASVARDDVIDKAVHYRSLQRRQVLEEIIGTEENYIADIRFLMNVRCQLYISPWSKLTCQLGLCHPPRLNPHDLPEPENINQPEPK